MSNHFAEFSTYTCKNESDVNIKIPSIVDISEKMLQSSLKKEIPINSSYEEIKWLLIYFFIYVWRDE